MKHIFNRVRNAFSIQSIIFGFLGILMSAGFAGCMGFLLLKSSNIHNHVLRNTVGSAVVKVIIPKAGGGSGFSTIAASGRNVIVTNEHVCSLSKNGWVFIKSDRGFTSKKKILHVDDKHDVCILEGDFRLPALKIGSAPEKGDFHYIVGHPGGRALTVSQGEYIEDHKVPMIDHNIKKREDCKTKVQELHPLEQFLYGIEFVCLKEFLSYSSSAVAYGGNSGSPVVNAFGEVIGILFAGNREQEHNTFIVPVTDLKRVLELI